MPRRGALARALAGAGLAVVAAGLTGCASHLDTVNPDSYIKGQGDGMLRIQTAYPNRTVSVGPAYPSTCASPPSVLGGPPGC